MPPPTTNIATASHCDADDYQANSCSCGDSHHGCYDDDRCYNYGLDLDDCYYYDDDFDDCYDYEYDDADEKVEHEYVFYYNDDNIYWHYGD